MNKRLLLLAIPFLLMACLCTPSTYIPVAIDPATDVPATSTIPPSPTLCSGIDCQAACDTTLRSIIDASEGSGSPIKSFSGSSGGTYSELVRYRVDGDFLVGATYPASPDELDLYKQDTTEHDAIWELFTTVIPYPYRQMVTEYIVFTDGRMELLAAVEPNSSGEDTWSLEVDILDAQNRKALTATLLHEYAHLLTLSGDQAWVVNSCPVDYANPGCGPTGSYIEAYYLVFWQDIYDEWAAINATSDDLQREDELAGFYEDHIDRFLTEYSTTDTAEDIAEAWMYYILVPKPDGATTMAEEKILFFYAYPELVQLREEIIARLCTAFPPPTQP